MKRTTNGFTLIELLVVISIISMLSSVVIASLSGARDKGRVGSAQIFASHAFQAIGYTAVGHWTFDEVNTGGTVATDYSGNNLNGTISGSGVVVSTDTNNASGKSLLFSGGVVDMGDPAPLQLSSNGTITAWIKPSAQGGGWRFIALRRNCYGLSFSNGTFGVWDGVTSTFYSTGQVLNDNKWHHLTFTFKNGVANGSDIYIDGKKARSSFTFNVNTSPNPFTIGNAQGGGYNYTGYIDEVIVYGSALTAREVEMKYAEGLTRHVAANR